MGTLAKKAAPKKRPSLPTVSYVELINLPDQDLHDAEKVWMSFYKAFPLRQIREIARDWLSAGIVHSYYNDGRNRSDLLYFFENLFNGVEAMYHILGLHRRSPKEQRGYAPLLYRHLANLTPKDLQMPEAVWHHFFDNYHLHEIRDHATEWLSAALVHRLYDDAEQRAKLLRFFQHLFNGVEASYQKKDKGISQKKSAVRKPVSATAVRPVPGKKAALGLTKRIPSPKKAAPGKKD